MVLMFLLIFMLSCNSYEPELFSFDAKPFPFEPSDSHCDRLKFLPDNKKVIGGIHGFTVDGTIISAKLRDIKPPGYYLESSTYRYGGDRMESYDVYYTNNNTECRVVFIETIRETVRWETNR